MNCFRRCSMRTWLAGTIALVAIFASLWIDAALAQKERGKKKGRIAITDAKAAGPDFAVQGEYLGDLPFGEKGGAQVIAEGAGKFSVRFLKGGLPGAGWDG